MTEYLLSATAETVVEAENPEEAKEDIWWQEHNPDFTQVEAEPLSPDNDYFKIHIRQAGSNKRSAGYRMMKSQSAMDLAFSTVNNISRDLVGQDAPVFKFELACLLLSSLEGDSVEKENIWEAVQEMNEDVHENGREEIENMWAIVDEEAESQ
jgi:hypothetical protein